MEAARAVGASDTKVMLRHVLPKVGGVMVVQATLTAEQGKDAGPPEGVSA